MKPFPLLVVLALSAAACAGDPLQIESEPSPSSASAQVRPELGDAFELRPGEVASLSGGDLLVAFRKVASDSRCPIDVNCVWAGDAELVIGVAAEGGSWEWFTLHTGVEPRSRAANGFTIELVDLAPDTRAYDTIPSGAYIAQLRITRS